MASDSSSSYQAPYAESTASRSSPPPEIIEPSDNNPEVFTPQHSVPNSEPFTFFTANTHPTQPPDEPPRASTPMDASTSSSLTNPSAPSSVYGQYVLWEELASGIPSASLPNEDVWLFRRPGEIFEDLRISAQHEIRRSGINFRNAEKRAEEVRSNGGNGSDGELCAGLECEFKLISG